MRAGECAVVFPGNFFCSSRHVILTMEAWHDETGSSSEGVGGEGAFKRAMERIAAYSMVAQLLRVGNVNCRWPGTRRDRGRRFRLLRRAVRARNTTALFRGCGPGHRPALAGRRVALGVQQAGVQQMEFGQPPAIAVFADQLCGAGVVGGGFGYAGFVQKQVAAQQCAFGEISAHIALQGNGLGGFKVSTGGGRSWRLRW